MASLNLDCCFMLLWSALTLGSQFAFRFWSGLVIPTHTFVWEGIVSQEKLLLESHPLRNKQTPSSVLKQPLQDLFHHSC
jgi:hypothetical protein